MVDAQTRPMPDNESPVDPAVWEEEERRMRELIASLPPPPDLEALARAQGVLPITSLDDLPRWPENDMDAWDGFDEFLEELRHGEGDLRRWVRDPKPDER